MINYSATWGKQVPYLENNTLTADVSHRLHYQFIGGDSTRPCLIFLHEGLGCIDVLGTSKITRGKGCSRGQEHGIFVNGRLFPGSIRYRTEIIIRMKTNGIN